ncbi:MAG: methyltransferase domain-containing protein [Candidatus Omnitrophica bacterium]|nr:methyltransferase domain-containing protein [Candidatus Omnitrophota bacterium]
MSAPIQATKPAVRRREDCRLCGSRQLQRVVSLEATPPANEFVTAKERGLPQERFPLDVHLCAGCGHVQLLDVVDPERLFRQYVYISSTSPVFVDHFRRYAASMLELMRLPAGAQVVEIGSNDGTLLRFFKDAGMRVLRIDPARRIAEEATRGGIETLPEFFDLALATRLRLARGAASLILANNVFAHADDLHTIADGVAHWLTPNGLFVFEVSYLLDVFEHTLFDTIYHEHLSYHTVKPLVEFFARHGMELVDAVRVESHGGSLRGMVKKAGGHWPKQARVDELIALESRLGLHSPAAYRAMFDRIEQRKAELTELLKRLKGDGKKIVGFGAPAKATTLMFHFGLGPETLDYIIDDSPLKQGLYTPGHHLPVVASSALYEPATRPDYAVILAWNFADPIIATHRRFLDAGGHFIIPLPTVQVR